MPVRLLVFGSFLDLHERRRKAVIYDLIARVSSEA